MNENSLALANTVLEMATDNGTTVDDVICCCALLVANVSKKSGEPLEYLLNEVGSQSRKVTK